MHHATVIHVLAVKALGKYTQETVRAGPHPAPQGCAPLAHDCIEMRQLQQYPERIIVLNAQGAVLPLRIPHLQTARVKGRAKCPK